MYRIKKIYNFLFCLLCTRSLQPSPEVALRYLRTGSGNLSLFHLFHLLIVILQGPSIHLLNWCNIEWENELTYPLSSQCIGDDSADSIWVSLRDFAKFRIFRVFS